jgi:hypothetical protein
MIPVYRIYKQNKETKTKTPSPLSASDRCLSGKLVPTFADIGCHVVSATNPRGRILAFYTGYTKLVRVLNSATFKIPIKSMVFTHRKIRKYTWTSPDGKTHNQIDDILVDRWRHSSALEVQSFRAADCDYDHCLVVRFMERLAMNKQKSQI